MLSEDAISLDTLYTQRLEREKKRVQDYNTAYQDVIRKIIQANNRDETEILFPVPQIMWGRPQYDMRKCIAFIMVKLQKKKFIVKYIHPNTLYICWQLDPIAYPEHTARNIEQTQQKMIADISSTQNIDDDLELQRLIDKGKLI